MLLTVTTAPCGTRIPTPRPPALHPPPSTLHALPWVTQGQPFAVVHAQCGDSLYMNWLGKGWSSPTAIVEIPARA